MTQPPEWNQGVPEGWVSPNTPAPPAGWVPPHPPAPPGGWAQPPQVPPPGVGDQWEQLGGPSYAVPSAKPRSRGKLILAAAVAAAAVGAGGVVTYAAVGDKNSNGGAASPREAIQTIIDDLNKSDVIGVLEDLAPGERAALVNPALDSIEQLKRLKIVQKSADPNAVAGVKFQASNLQFAPDTITVNDHVQVVQLTGGTVSLGSDLSKVPFTGEFLKAAFPHGVPAAGAPQQLDISTAVAHNDGPLRLAAQRVGGRWYPSIFYTIADNAAHSANQTPSSADYIPAVGASSPENAVRQAVTALVNGDLTAAIKLAAPDELAALHDYGGLVVKAAGDGRAPVTIKELQLTSRPISGGGRRVTLTKVTVADRGGREYTVAVDGNCYQFTQHGQPMRLCTDNLVAQLSAFLGGFGIIDNVTQEQRDALSHLVAGLANVGLDTTEHGGAWYVNPARSYLDIVTSVLGSLQNDDALQIVRFFSSLGA